MAESDSFPLLQYGVDYLKHAIYTRHSESPVLETRRPILVILKINNLMGNDVRLANGRIVEAGGEHISAPPQIIRFAISPEVYDNENSMCKRYIYSKLAMFNVEMFTDDILDYMVNVVKQCVPPKGKDFKASVFLIKGELVLIRHRVFHEEFVLRGLKKMASHESREHCAICLEDLSGARECTVTPCSHIFHSGCVATWLVQRQSCPMCRTMVRIRREI